MSATNCQGKTTKGEPCQAYATASGFCFMHDDTRAKERAVARRSGGLRSKSPHFATIGDLPSDITAMQGVLALLNYTLKEAGGLDNSIQRGRLLVSIAHGYIEAIKVGEIEKRLEAVEIALALKK